LCGSGGPRGGTGRGARGSHGSGEVPPPHLAVGPSRTLPAVTPLPPPAGFCQWATLAARRAAARARAAATEQSVLALSTRQLGWVNEFRTEKYEASQGPLLEPRLRYFFRFLSIIQVEGRRGRGASRGPVGRHTVAVLEAGLRASYDLRDLQARFGTWRRYTQGREVSPPSGTGPLTRCMGRQARGRVAAARPITLQREMQRLRDVPPLPSQPPPGPSPP
jgi:hypothetical protein